MYNLVDRAIKLTHVQFYQINLTSLKITFKQWLSKKIY